MPPAPPIPEEVPGASAGAEGVDPLGYYLGTWGYAYMQFSAQAIDGDQEPRRRQDRRLLPHGTFKTIMGDMKFGAKGEWAEGRMMQVQYHGIKGRRTGTRHGHQTVLTPGRATRPAP